MTEHTVQVPVSLIERARDALRSAHPDKWAVYEELHALLSQPTVSLPTRDQIAEVLYRITEMQHPWPRDRARNQADAVLALLSQPAQTAEPYTPEDGPAPWGYLETDRIEDMAPGTTFTAVASGIEGGSGRRRHFTKAKDPANSPGYGLFESRSGGSYFPRDIDPSTIRDVTPPTPASAD